MPWTCGRKEGRKEGAIATMLSLSELEHGEHEPCHWKELKATHLQISMMVESYFQVATYFSRTVLIIPRAEIMICIRSSLAPRLLEDLPHGSSQTRVREQVGLREQGKRLVTEALLQHENCSVMQKGGEGWWICSDGVSQVPY
jgi:hypothetical protein